MKDTTAGARGGWLQAASDRLTRIYDLQVAAFTVESLGAMPTRTLNSSDRPSSGAERPREVIAVDIGGDKLVAALYKAENGLVVHTEELLRLEALGGRGYLNALMEITSQARHRGVSIGISHAGHVQENRALTGPNLPVFISDFERSYDLDFRKIFAWSAALNDGEAGVIAAAALAQHVFGNVSNVVLIINGSGLNAAAVIGQQVYSMEAGHVKVYDRLNWFGQKKLCPVSSPPHVCVEHVASSRAGIEDIWRQQTGKAATGREIAQALSQGSKLARDLYQGSAVVTAHVVYGVFKAFNIEDDWSSSVVMCHGGTFNVPGFTDYLATVLAEAFGSKARIMCASDFSSNVCLDGAAYAALALEHPS